jgi:acyl-CoA thioester hydrolase
MAAIYPYHHVVQDDEVEPDGYVSCLTYLLWTRSAALAHSAEHGWGEQCYLDLGIAWVVRSHSIQYFRPAFTGEEVVVETWVSNFGKTKSLRKYRISRPADDKLLVTAETNWALIDIAKRRPFRIPSELKEAFPIVTESEEPLMKPRSTAQTSAD